MTGKHVAVGDPTLVNEDLSIVERRKGPPHLIDSIQRRGSVIVTPMETERAAHIGNSAVTLAGSTLIALGHLRNFSLCRRMDYEQ